MRLSRIHIESPLSIDTEVRLPEKSAHYIKQVLRLKSESEVILFNGIVPKDFLGCIRLAGKEVFVTPVEEQLKLTESPIESTIVQAIGKSDHMDYLIQKSTELGVSQLVLFNSERTQSPLKASRLDKKIQHWKNIAISACEQSGRNSVPFIEFKNNLKDTLEHLSEPNRIMLDFSGLDFKQLADSLDASQPFNILVGAEGGLSGEEITYAKNSGFLSCEVGPRVLRMETAGVAVLSIVQHYFGDM